MLHESDSASDVHDNFMVARHRCDKMDQLVRYNGAHHSSSKSAQPSLVSDFSVRREFHVFCELLSGELVHPSLLLDLIREHISIIPVI